MTPRNLWLAGLITVVALTFETLLSTEQVPSFRDLLFFFLPFKAFLAEHLQRGEFPLWNPWILMGTPFLGSLQTTVFYPPSLLLTLPFPLGLNLFLLFHYLVALAGVWPLLRARGLSLPASALGALTFVIGGYLVSMLNVLNNLQTAAWAPALLFLWDRRLETRRTGFLVAFTLTLSLQILGGAPEVVAMTLLTIGAWTLVRRAGRPLEATRAGATLAGAATLAAGLVAFQLLPTAELVGRSTRGAAFGFEQVSFWSMEPVSLLQLLFPHSASLVTVAERHSVGQILEPQLPWISSLYLGLVPLCLVVVGVTTGRERWFWGPLALLGIALALGKNAPLFPLFYELAPEVVGKFRYPEKFFFLSHLAATLLCAEGADRLFGNELRPRRMAWTICLSLLAVGSIPWLLGTMRPLDLLHLTAILRGEALPPMAFAGIATDLVFKSQRLVVILGTFAALLALRRSVLREGTAGLLIVGLAAADLGAAHHNLNLTISWPELLRRPLPIHVEALQERHHRFFYYQTVSSYRSEQPGMPIAGLEEGSRLIDNTEDLRAFSFEEWKYLPGNVPMVYGVGTVLGAEGIDRREVEVFRDVLSIVPRERAVHLLRLYSVAELIGSGPIEAAGLEPIDPAGTVAFAYRIREPLPRAYLVSSLREGEFPIAAFNGLIAADFDAGGEAVVDRLPQGWVNPETPASLPPVRILRYQSQRVTLETAADRPALLVLNDSFFPGWTARIDGEPTEILRTNALARGVVVPPGEHEVEFRYRPRSLDRGIYVSMVAAITLLAVAVLGALFSRRD